MFVALEDGVDFVGAFFGILEIGAIVVMVNPSLPQDRAEELLERCSPAAVVAGDGSVFANIATRHGVAVVTAPLEPGRKAEDFAPVPRHPRNPAIWLFSGGTTGVPKVVPQVHYSFVNTTRLYAHETLQFGEDDVTLSVPKLYFGYATGSNLLFPFSVGGSTILFPEHLTPEILFELITDYRPTILINVPTMIAKMVGHETANSQDLSSLRFATSAGEGLPVELYHSWKSMFGVELLDGLGTAEMWHVFITNRPGDVKPGTLGKPVIGFEVSVRDPDGFGSLPPGQVGLLRVRGESCAAGYWGDQDASEAAFEGGEWFIGGDLVRIDSEGYVEHHGRADDRLKVGGKWLAPQEVESCLLEHDEVDSAVVVGIANEEGLIKPVAFVIPTAPRDGLEDDLMRWTLDRLETYKHPRQIFLLEALPTTHLGKVDRTKLKEIASEA